MVLLLSVADTFYMSRDSRNINGERRDQSTRSASRKAWYKAMKEQKCHYCHTAQGVTRDHVTPFAFGGKTTQDNLVPSCEKCNNEFGTKFFKCECSFCLASYSKFIAQVAEWKNTGDEKFGIIQNMMDSADWALVQFSLEEKVAA